MGHTLLFHFISHDFFVENWTSLIICGYSGNHIPPTPAVFTKVYCFSVCPELIRYSLSCVAPDVSVQLAQWSADDWIEISLNILNQ